MESQGFVKAVQGDRRGSQSDEEGGGLHPPSRLWRGKWGGAKT